MTPTRAKAIAAEAGFSIFAVGTHGATLNEVMVPNRQVRGEFAGKFIASRTNKKQDYVAADTIEELILLVRRGFGVRMAPIGKSTPSNLFSSSSIYGAP
jgi:hypothetical protein